MTTFIRIGSSFRRVYLGFRPEHELKMPRMYRDAKRDPKGSGTDRMGHGDRLKRTAVPLLSGCSGVMWRSTCSPNRPTRPLMAPEVPRCPKVRRSAPTESIGFLGKEEWVRSTRLTTRNSIEPLP